MSNPLARTRKAASTKVRSFDDDLRYAGLEKHPTFLTAVATYYARRHALHGASVSRIVTPEKQVASHSDMTATFVNGVPRRIDLKVVPKYPNITVEGDTSDLPDGSPTLPGHPRRDDLPMSTPWNRTDPGPTDVFWWLKAHQKFVAAAYDDVRAFTEPGFIAKNDLDWGIAVTRRAQRYWRTLFARMSYTDAPSLVNAAVGEVLDNGKLAWLLPGERRLL